MEWTSVEVDSGRYRFSARAAVGGAIAELVILFLLMMLPAEQGCGAREFWTPPRCGVSVRPLLSARGFLGSSRYCGGLRRSSRVTIDVD